MALARERLSTIGMGFFVCLFTNLLIFPMWASDELHESTASKFGKLAGCIEGCLENYFKIIGENEKQPSANVGSCKSALYSKSTEESLAKVVTYINEVKHSPNVLTNKTPIAYESVYNLFQANFAKWEPRHGKFGFHYPWEKYLHIGEALRDLSATIICLKGCVESPKQPSSTTRQELKEPCKIVGSKLVQILRELGESIIKMKRCHATILMLPKLQALRMELSLLKSPKLEELDTGESIAIASFMFLLMEIVDKVEVLAKEVEELGKMANFNIK